jgi:hypothetical protein
MKPFPCKNCITYAICKSSNLYIGQRIPSKEFTDLYILISAEELVFALLRKCTIFKKWYMNEAYGNNIEGIIYPIVSHITQTHTKASKTNLYILNYYYQLELNITKKTLKYKIINKVKKWLNKLWS